MKVLTHTDFKVCVYKQLHSSQLEPSGTWPAHLNDVLASSCGNVRESHQDTVPQNPGRNDVLRGGGAREREERNHPLQVVPLTRRRAYHLPTLYQVSATTKGRIKMFTFTINILLIVY